MTTALKFKSYGDQNARTILFLHGGGVAGWMWDPVVPLLPEFYCLVPDMPEHGASMDVRPFTMQLAADEAAALVREQAHGGVAVVVGLSEGAQVAALMLSTAPEVMEKAFVSSALLLPMKGMGWLNSPGLLRASFRMSIPPFRNNNWWMRLNMKYSAAIPEAYFPQYRANFQIMNEDQFVDLLVENQKFRLPAGLEKVSVPTLALAGRHEYPVMRESARLLAQSLPHAQARLIDLGPGSSMRTEHNWAMNAPDQFAAAVRAFINGTDLPAVLHPLD